MSADDYSAGWHTEGDELVRRLSKLEWAPVPAELRQRCWKDFEERVAQNGSAGTEMARSRPAYNVGERYEMRRFAPARRLAVAEQSQRRLASSARLAAVHAATRGYTPRRAFSLT